MFNFLSFLDSGWFNKLVSGYVWVIPLFIGFALICFIIMVIWRPKLTENEQQSLEEKKELNRKKREEKENLKAKGFGWQKNLLFLFIVSFVVVMVTPIGTRIWAYLSPPPLEITFSEFREDIAEERVKQLVVGLLHDGNRKVVGEYTTGHFFQVVAPDSVTQDLKAIQDLAMRDKKKMAPRIRFEEPAGWFYTLLANWGPMLLLAGVWIFFMSRMRAGGIGGGNPFQKKASKLGEKPKTRFTDVAGLDEPKEELFEVIEFLKNPQTFTVLGAKIPRGLLLVGPSGCGKTLLAKATAGESDVPFFSMSGSEFVEVFVGVGASRVRDLFEQAKKSAPCIIFIDEIDAVGRHRGAGLGGGNDEREQTLNQLLVAMDGFEPNNGIIVIAATNRPDILDPALLRPGRFDRRIIVDNPNGRGRREILEVHLRGIPVASDVSMESLAKQTPGFSGADLASVVNEGALFAARHNKKLVNMADFEEAIERVIGGPLRRSRVLTPKEREMVAHHEAGHAILRKLLPHADPPQKVTIISRGMALGYVMGAPPEDRNTRTKLELLDEIAVAMGGRVAEELVFGDVSTGAANDFEQATDMARKMVTSFGMSNALGPIALGKGQGPVFLGRDFTESKNYGEAVASQIDQEIKNIIVDAYARAKQTMTANRDKLERVACALLERETLSGEELDDVMNQNKP